MPVPSIDRRSPSWSEKFKGAASTLPPNGSSRSGFRVRVLTGTPWSNNLRATYLPVKLKAPVTIAVLGWDRTKSSLKNRRATHPL